MSIKLYKYYSEEDYNIEAVKEGYWFFKKFGYANDPFDCNVQLLDLINNKWNLKSCDIKTDSMKDFAACCFSDSPMNKHLWSLYASNYSGFVVEYDFSEDDYEEFTCKGLPIPLLEVSYLNKNEIMSMSEILPTRIVPPIGNNISSERKITQEQEDLFFFLYSIKEKEIWQAEHEKRLLLGNLRPKEDKKGVFETDIRNNGYKIYFTKRNIKCIYVGYNMRTENLSSLKDVAKEYAIPMKLIEKDKPFELKQTNIEK